MITPPLNSSDCSAYLLEVVKGEAFNLTVEVSDELPLTGKVIRFITKSSLADTNYNHDFSTTNGKITVAGQVITLIFSATDTTEIGELLCEFWFIGLANDIRSSGIGKFRILQPLAHD